MANYATNIFHARTENKTDLDKIEDFLDDTFSEFTNRYGDSVDAEFSSRWVYPEEEIKKLVESLEDKDKVYIKILTYEFEDEYVSFRIFSQGEWKVKLVTEWVEEDKVKLWLTFNEIDSIIRHPFMTGGLIESRFKPEEFEEVEYQAMHHQFVASALAVKMAHEIDPNYQVGCMQIMATSYGLTCNPNDQIENQQKNHLMKK